MLTTLSIQKQKVSYFNDCPGNHGWWQLMVASFQGLPTIQFLITCSLRKWLKRRPGNKVDFSEQAHCLTCLLMSCSSPTGRNILMASLIWVQKYCLQDSLLCQSSHKSRGYAPLWVWYCWSFIDTYHVVLLSLQNIIHLTSSLTYISTMTYPVSKINLCVQVYIVCS